MNKWQRPALRAHAGVEKTLHRIKTTNKQTANRQTDRESEYRGPSKVTLVNNFRANNKKP